MKIAKTNISYGDYYFDVGSEVIAPAEVLQQISALWYEVPDKEEVKEKMMKTDILRDKKLKSYKNK